LQDYECLDKDIAGKVILYKNIQKNGGNLFFNPNFLINFLVLFINPPKLPVQIININKERA
jgi:hypothetical protein